MRETRTRPNRQARTSLAPEVALNTERSADDTRAPVVTAEDAVAAVPEPESYEDLSKARLMAKCRDRGFSVSGTKQVLIDRLLGG